MVYIDHLASNSFFGQRLEVEFCDEIVGISAACVDLNGPGASPGLLQGHAMSEPRTCVPTIDGGKNIQRTVMISLAEGPGKGFRPVFLIKTVYLISASISRGRSPRRNPPVPVGHGITHKPFRLRAEGDWRRNPYG